MSDIVGKYADIIYTQAHTLTETNLVCLNPQQCRAVKNIKKNTKSLMIFLATYEQTHPNLSKEALRHEIIDKLTPIIGYSDMLADEWSENPKDNQVYHFKLINQCVTALRKHLLTQHNELGLSVSA